MITINLKCRKCGKDIDFGTEQEGFVIKIIPHECKDCNLKNKINRLENPICDLCGEKINGHEFAFIGDMKNVLIHQACYPGGQEAYFQYCRKEKMEG